MGKKERPLERAELKLLNQGPYRQYEVRLTMCRFCLYKEQIHRNQDYSKAIKREAFIFDVGVYSNVGWWLILEFYILFFLTYPNFVLTGKVFTNRFIVILFLH